jgi:hypothetical protein
MYGIFGEIFFSIQKTSRKYTEIFKMQKMSGICTVSVYYNFCSEVVKSGQFDPKSG